ncbi:MAG: CerR family C-terminal domain-containing protein [Gemmatimonadota bacterium]|nr:CerR family C-terminal domain-containing protein [Gemmatimonadota bacterium]HEU4990251.1 CerR family C-terminal domain-containing protein [Gemmatimonadaceae bacterium]
MTTRDRLLKAAIARFSEHGYRMVSVRDICADARANVAAVNYHFGGKLGLYREVVNAAIEAIRSASESALFAADDVPPVERLRQYVNAYVHTIAAREKTPERERLAWVHDLMAHESMEPTPLAPWIAEQALMPRLRYLSALVAELMRCKPSDPRVTRCVISIQSQCLFYAAPNKFRDTAFPGWPLSAAGLAAAADHIVAFSLAGVRRVARAR